MNENRSYCENATFFLGGGGAGQHGWGRAGVDVSKELNLM